MAGSLSDFINLLKNITPNVYYQPGDKDSITYPCIVVADNYTDATYSNNIVSVSYTHLTLPTKA